MRHGRGTTSDKPEAKVRRREQPQHEEAKRESNRRRAIGGGQPDELGVTQGQNAEQGNTVDPRLAYNRGKARH